MRYSARIPARRWAAVRDEFRCLIRRARPTSTDDLRLHRSAASSLLRWAESNKVSGSLGELLDENTITRCVAGIASENTRKFYRARLRALAATAHHLPRHRRHGDAPASAALSARLVELRARMECATPLMDQDPPKVSSSDFQRIIRTLPHGDVAPFLGELRG